MFNIKKSSCHQKNAPPVARIVSQIRIASTPAALELPNRQSSTTARLPAQLTHSQSANLTTSRATRRARLDVECESDRSHTILPTLKLPIFFARLPLCPTPHSSPARTAARRPK